MTAVICDFPSHYYDVSASYYETGNYWILSNGQDIPVPSELQGRPDLALLAVYPQAEIRL